MSLSASPADPAARARAEIQRMYRRIGDDDHFSFLGVDREASDEEIKARYIALAKKWHRDAYADLELGPETALIDAIFKRISDAFQTLSHPDARAEHVIYLERRRAGLSTNVEDVLRSETRVDEGLAELGRKRYRQALACFEEALKLNPNDPLIRTYRAWARYRANHSSAEAAQAAKKELRGALSAQENLPEAYRYMGQVALEHGDLDKALRWLNTCLEWSSNDVEATRLLRLARSRKGKQRPAGLMARLMRMLGSR